MGIGVGVFVGVGIGVSVMTIYSSMNADGEAVASFGLVTAARDDSFLILNFNNSKIDSPDIAKKM